MIFVRELNQANLYGKEFDVICVNAMENTISAFKRHTQVTSE